MYELEVIAQQVTIDDQLLFSAIDGEIMRLSDGKRVKIKPVVARLFSYLLKHPNQIVRRSELLKNVWEKYGFVVSDNSVNQTIWALREALELADPNGNRVKTIPRIGYCFIGKVTKS